MGLGGLFMEWFGVRFLQSSHIPHHPLLEGRGRNHMISLETTASNRVLFVISPLESLVGGLRDHT